MNHVVLEFEKLEILKPRERWKLYFVIVSDHPGEQDKLLVGNIPAEFIRLKPQEQNTISFKPAGDKGADGLFVLESPLPASKRIKARAYLLHSRQGTRSIGKFMKEMKGGLGADALDVVTDMLGTSSPWLVIAKKALPLIGDVLRKIKDRDFGFISLDEKFALNSKRTKN